MVLMLLVVKSHVWQQEKAFKDTFFLTNFTVQSQLASLKTDILENKMSLSGKGVRKVPRISWMAPIPLKK